MVNGTTKLDSSYPLSTWFPKLIHLVCGVQVQKMANPAWQLMFLQSDGQVSYMSVSEAQRWGYSLTSTAQRSVLRARYKRPQAEMTMVGNSVGRQSKAQSPQTCILRCLH